MRVKATKSLIDFLTRIVDDDPENVGKRLHGDLEAGLRFQFEAARLLAQVVGTVDAAKEPTVAA